MGGSGTGVGNDRWILEAVGCNDSRYGCLSDILELHESERRAQKKVSVCVDEHRIKCQPAYCSRGRQIKYLTIILQCVSYHENCRSPVQAQQ